MDCSSTGMTFIVTIPSAERMTSDWPRVHCPNTDGVFEAFGIVVLSRRVAALFKVLLLLLLMLF